MHRWFAKYRWITVSLMVVLLITGLGWLTGCGQNGTSGDQLNQVMKRGVLIAGVKYDSRPFGYLDTDGQLKGFDVELLREIAKRLLGHSSKVQFRQVLSSTRIIALNTESVDLVAATMSITPEREELVDFSQPYYVARQAVVVRQASPIRHLNDLKGKTVFYTMGATSAPQLKNRVEGVELRGFKSPTEAFSALLAGRGDAMTTDNTIMAGLVDGREDVRVLRQAVAPEPYGLGFRQGQESTAFREKINQLLAAMEADGTLDKLRKKWVPDLNLSTD